MTQFYCFVGPSVSFSHFPRKSGELEQRKLIIMTRGLDIMTSRMSCVTQHSPPSSVITITLVAGPSPSGLRTCRARVYSVYVARSLRMYSLRPGFLMRTLRRVPRPRPTRLLLPPGKLLLSYESLYPRNSPLIVNGCGGSQA